MKSRVVRRQRARLLLALLGAASGLFVAATANAAPAAGPTPNVNQLVARAINAIRASDGLVTGTYTNAYQPQLRQALANATDPAFPSQIPGALAEYSLWGEVPVSTSGTTSPSTVVAAWVTHDGWRGTQGLTWNVDCVALGAPGCNGHRRAVLSRPPSPHAKLLIATMAQRVTVAGTLEWRVATLLIWREAN